MNYKNKYNNNKSVLDLSNITTADGVRTYNNTVLSILRIMPEEGYFAAQLPIGHQYEYRGKEVWFDIKTGRALGMVNVSEWNVKSVIKDIESYSEANFRGY